MTNIKNSVSFRGLFYWLFTIGLGIKVLDIYLTAKDMFYLEHVLQGFVLTILMPTFLVITIMGFASFIEINWFSYTVTFVIAFVGSSLLFFSSLCYRIEKHFNFFPDKTPTVSDTNSVNLNLFNQIQIRDIIFVFDFIIIVLILLSVLALKRRISIGTETKKPLDDGQERLSSLQPSVELCEENSVVQETFLMAPKDKEAQLTIHNSVLAHEPLATPTVTHVVKARDTLWDNAPAQEVAVEASVKHSKKHSSGDIYEGQELTFKPPINAGVLSISAETLACEANLCLENAQTAIDIVTLLMTQEDFALEGAGGASREGFRVDDQPIAKSTIAVFIPDSADTDATYRHIAVVIDVSGDTVTVKEMNTAAGLGKTRTRVISRCSASYIHMA
ncbi:hypothetical protein RyT2_04830 [Pseudolactococcus yaeyamensis]